MNVGTRLGVFEILGPLGSGGMGEVYRARDTRLGREVALKTLPASLASDPSRLARLRREARILASLSHPHIAKLFGLEESEGAPVLVMELVEGRTLAEHLLRGALPVAEALDRARQIAAGLEAAHEKGVLHRDLKPSNIAVDPKGRVKLLDFAAGGAAAGSSWPGAASTGRSSPSRSCSSGSGPRRPHPRVGDLHARRASLPGRLGTSTSGGAGPFASPARAFPVPPCR